MIEIYATQEGRTQAVASYEHKNVWVVLTAPTKEELSAVGEHLCIPMDFMLSATDPEERPRIEADEQVILIVIDIPIALGEGQTSKYDTLPLSVIITPTHFVTVCLQENLVIKQLLKQRAINTAKRTQLLLQLLFRTATQHLHVLRQIDRKTDEIEMLLRLSMRNTEFFQLLELQKSLVYISTSLRSNQAVLDRLTRIHLAKDIEFSPLRMYEEDAELLEDTITENKQALEMAAIYTGILSGTMDAYASVVSNNLNIVMKFLTSVTIVMSIPALVGAFYGMNVQLPLQDNPFAFFIILGAATLLSVIVAWVLARRKLF
jgi:magnesium transporter